MYNTLLVDKNHCEFVILLFSHSLIPRHSIQSGVWNSTNLAYSNGVNYTIMDAIDIWYQNGSSGMNFRDLCTTPHCNTQCPEQFIFNSLQPDEWPMVARLSLAAVVVTIAVGCILLKVSIEQAQQLVSV